MQRVLMILLSVMHFVFISGYFINHGIIFFSSYFWIFFSIVTFSVAFNYQFADVSANEKNLTYRIFAKLLMAVSLISLAFVLYVKFVNPYLYLFAT